jgi:hypothetical protein
MMKAKTKGFNAHRFTFDKSWVVGVQIGTHARAYDWNDLLRTGANDTLAEPLWRSLLK